MTDHQNSVTMTDKDRKSIIQQIQAVYRNDPRPWVIGYSGGKDSTLTAQFVLEAISELPLKERIKEVHIVTSNTLVENPLILNYVETNINAINDFSEDQKLKVTGKLLSPKIDETFWSLLLGKGYPSPRQKFRWCTHRLKIKPIDQYINKLVKKHGSVIVVLGVRRSESQSRNQTIDSHTVAGKVLKTHATNPNAHVFAPIEHLDTNDVWGYLIGTHTPWGSDNNLLLSLYRDASDESECPIQQDLNAPSCGQSRFGCWTCTVVQKDKSLSGFIQNDYAELRPLLKFRNQLQEMRDKDEYRQKWRMNGSVYFVGKDEDRRQGNGPFTLEARKKLLTMLLKTEVEFNKLLKTASSNRFSVPSEKVFKLITLDELKVIRESWINDGDWEDSLPKIYEAVYSQPYNSGYSSQPFFTHSDILELERICHEENVEIDLIKSLIKIENDYWGLAKRPGIQQKIDSVLKQDRLHQEILTLEGGTDHADTSGTVA